jgi:uncharacterized repeat protein (TIGR03847 family)
MPRQVFLFDPPERFVAGTVGEPGTRTFYLQARSGRRVTSVALEKQQVAVLAERLDALLDEVLRLSGGAPSVPAVAPPELDDVDPLEQPIVEEFRVGTMALAWDGADERVVVEAQAQTPEDEEPPDPPIAGDDVEDGEAEVEGPDLLRVRLSGAQARAFAKRAMAVVAAGRPACPFCGLPLDPAGHICPRQNGYRR